MKMRMKRFCIVTTNKCTKTSTDTAAVLHSLVITVIVSAQLFTMVYNSNDNDMACLKNRKSLLV